MSDKFVHSQDSHDFYQPDYFSRFPNYFKILQSLKEKGEVEGNDGEQIDHVHWPADELELPRTARQADEVLEREETDGDDIDDVDDL